MSRPFTTGDKLLSLMSDGKPRSTREVAEQIGVTMRAAEFACHRYWKLGPVLRSEKPLHEANTVSAGSQEHHTTPVPSIFTFSGMVGTNRVRSTEIRHFLRGMWQLRSDWRPNRV